MTGTNRLTKAVLTLGVLLPVVFLGGLRLLQAGPPKGVDQAQNKGLTDQQRVDQEVARIVGDIKVSLEEEGKPVRLDLLEGPLLQHEVRGFFVQGTLWAWGTPGRRPEALLSLSLTPPVDNPRWCHEMVSLSTKPISATTRSNTWWSTKTAGWNPKPIPGAPGVAKTPEERLRQMKELAARFSASRYFSDPNKLIKMSLLGEPILRYTPSSGDTVDGAMFVLVVPVKNPEILLIIEAEKDAQGTATWKYNAPPVSSNGLVLRCDGKEVWTRKVINWLSTKASDPYRIYLVSAREEIRQSEAEGRR